VSGDENYQGINLPTLTAVNHDDETAFMVVIEPQAGLKTSESGGKAIVSVSLNQPPNQALVISFQSSDETEGVVQPSRLRFTPQNFDTSQEITITGIDDFLVDGNTPYWISTELSPMAALPSSALSGELFVTNDDDDSGETISFKVTPNRLESTLSPNETIALPLLVTPSAPGPTNFEISIEEGAEENEGDTWITVTPLSWTAASGEQQVVLVELNSNNRSEAHLSATITIVNVNSPESRQSVQVSLDITHPCPSGLSDSLQIGLAQIGGFASLALVAENTLFFEVEYQSKVTQVFPNKDLQFPFPNLSIPKNAIVAGFQLGPVTADSPTAIIRAFGQNQFGEQCFESLEIDIEYAEAGIVAVRVLNEDGSTAPKTVPAETKLVIEIETDGASSVSVGETTMISDLNPNSNFRNTWTLSITSNENLVLPITLKTPGNPPIVSMDPDFPELIIQVDLPPETADDFLTTDEDSVLTINVITDLLANDIDRDSEAPLRFITLVLNSNRGILMDNGDGTWQFDPNQDFETLNSRGRETINLSYLIEDAAGQSTQGNVHLEILGINDKPIVADDFFTLTNSEEVFLDILANDFDLDGELEILPLSHETKGEVDIDPAGLIRYVPDTFFGIDSFTYSVSDGDGGLGSARVIILIEKELLPEKTSPLADAADFNRDGQADILFQDAQGNLLLWLMKDGQVAHESGFSPSMLPDDNWKIAATADFNQDGFPDLVLQHPKDFLALWTLAGTTLIQSDFLVPFRTGTPSWHLAAAADFDGDETPDLVFQHLSGDLALWEMENNQRVEAKFFTPRRIGNQDWRVVGAADFNSDGKTDLLVRHVDGWIGVWFMNDTQFVAGTFLNPKRISLDWKTKGVSDYNSDNQPDILFQSEEGKVLIWNMDGVNLLESNEVDLRSPNPDFQIVGPK
ncbi:MAG TPA: VCBS repeat-containing protein, partial [Verrucomicrobia bacterium]|nr:VCBS repeat-containing protein [Verrucomicrobiota bacterium]